MSSVVRVNLATVKREGENGKVWSLQWKPWHQRVRVWPRELAVGRKGE